MGWRIIKNSFNFIVILILISLAPGDEALTFLCADKEIVHALRNKKTPRNTLHNAVIIFNTFWLCAAAMLYYYKQDSYQNIFTTILIYKYLLL